ncbi:hypothetical protein NOR53_2226 [gamma proteobacterium NOR5-3]|nr:hypothetical protein NOR53_2226 [gamma proteobacterium NOR5-3]
MLLRLFVLWIVGVLTGCASYTADYQNRLVRSLPNQREVTFNDTQTYPGKILCGSYTTLTGYGWNMRTGDFVVGESFIRSTPTADEVFVYCSKDPAAALYARLGIGAPDGNWAPLSKLRDDMLAIDEAINRYYDAVAVLPSTLDTLLEGDFGVSKDNLTDPWGRPYFYKGGLSGRTAPQYELGSLGADGVEGGQGADADIRKEQASLLDHVLGFVDH